VIKVNKNDIDLCNYSPSERDEFVTMVIRVMFKFNKGVVIRPIEIMTLNEYAGMVWHPVYALDIVIELNKNRKKFLKYLSFKADFTKDWH
jgi:hypothetical protein